MPIYEFYCRECHRLFNFLSRRIDTKTAPACPRCSRGPLERRVSRFAVSRGRPEEAGDGLPGDLDESRLEAVMESLARDAEGLDEDDPRQAARMMRRLFAETGLPVGDGMEEALRRMEAGEDPDKIEEELGDALEADPLGEPEAAAQRRGRLRRLLPPPVDSTLYEL